MIVGGIDAGGTKTECIIFDTEKKKILARAKTGSANYQVVGLEKAYQEIKKAVEKVLKQTTIDYISLMGIGMAGAGRNQDKKRIKNKLNNLSLVDKLFITDDGMIGLLAATEGKKGVIVIAGTGSIAYGLKENNHIIRSGGWGPLIGDEGSGFWMGIKAIRKAVRSVEGREDSTELIGLIKNFFSFDSLDELIPFLYTQELPRKEVASLAPEILRLAQNGDKIAFSIIDEGIEELCLLVSSVIKKLDYRENKVAVAGGLFSSKYFREVFRDKLKLSYNLEIYQPEYCPALGAVFYALEKSKGVPYY